VIYNRVGFVTTGEFVLILNNLDPTAHTGHSYNTEAGKPGNFLDFCKLRKHFHSRGFNSITDEDYQVAMFA